MSTCQRRSRQTLFRLAGIENYQLISAIRRRDSNVAARKKLEESAAVTAKRS
jgi:hypothetical protein